MPSHSEPVSVDSRTGDSLTKRERFALLLRAAYPHAHLAFPLAAMILILCNTYIILGPVINRSGDNMYHLLNEFTMLRGIRSGDNPFGPLGMEFGQPVLRFYQALYYLFNVGLTLATGLSLMFTHNLTIVICFALSPFSYFYFLRKLGLNRWAAAFGSFASISSIAAFGNSFEAYHQAGIVTQSMGGLFFPWFMGHFIGVLRGENRATTTAFLFALAFLSHAIMSVFAVFAGALYVAVTTFDLRVIAKRLAVFSVLGVSLVAFWLAPFLDHNFRMRPVPDSIIRGAGVHWFTSVSKDELALVLLSGRLLDDSRTMGDARDEADKLMDRISIIGTLKPRFPGVSILTALGVFVAIFNLRRPSRRFLLAGFFFSLMLFAGPDDFPWLHYMPFMNNIQTFRCTYLIEFFAFGLVGIGIETVFRYWFALARGRRRWLRITLVVLWTAAAATLAFFGGREIILLGQKHLHLRDPGYLNLMVDATGSLRHGGRPFRIAALFEGRYKLRQAWYGMHGFPPYCTHWKGTGPTAAYHLCTQLGSAERSVDLHALAGIRYFSGSNEKLKRFIEAKDADGDPILEKLPSTKDRRGKSTSGWFNLVETGRENFLRPLVGKPLPVICTHSQWIWLVKAWTGRYRHSHWEPNMPIPLRVTAGELGKSGLVDVAEAMLYLDHSELEIDRTVLEKMVARGAAILSPVEMSGIATIDPGDKRSIWDALPKGLKPTAKTHPSKQHRDERDPALDIAEVKQLRRGSGSVQRFAFDVDTMKSLVTVLPMEAAPGWGATLDGKPLPSFPAGPDMLGILLPKGAHRLIFSWSMPKRDKAWLTLSLIALIFVLGVWIRASIRRQFS